jgi:hypothetical protein
MADRLGMFPEAWQPKPEDKLIGTVTDTDDRDGEYGLYPIVCVLTDDGDEFAVHAFHAVLKTEFAKQQPEVGDRIGIAYHGKVKGKNSEYESNRVIIEKPNKATNTGPDWDRHGKEAKAELSGEELPPLRSDDEGPW